MLSETDSRESICDVCRWPPRKFSLRTSVPLPEPGYELGKAKRKRLGDALAAIRELGVVGEFIVATEYPLMPSGLAFVGDWREHLVEALALYSGLPLWRMWSDLCLWNDKVTVFVSLTHEGEHYRYICPHNEKRLSGKARLLLPQLAIRGRAFAVDAEAG